MLHSVFLLSGGLVQALQLIASLSLLILLHEFGHFFFARLFKTRVEKFYLFFDFLFPFPSVLNFALFKKKKGDTEYGLGWFPLGGYVKIAGMVDESMDKEALALPPEPWEYRSKKAWQRLLIMLGGIIMNVLVAITIYIAIFVGWGERWLPVENMKYGIAVDSVGQSLGLRNGDKILSANREPIKSSRDLFKGILFGDIHTIEVSRDGQPISVVLPESGTITRILKQKKAFIASPRFPLMVDSVPQSSYAYQMGMRDGDSILAINDQSFRFFDEFEQLKKPLAGKPVTLSVLHKGASAPEVLKGVLPAEGSFNFMFVPPDRFLQEAQVRYNVFEAIPRGIAFTGETFVEYWGQFKLLFTSKEVKLKDNLGGMVSFGKMYAPTFDWQDFLLRTAFVSIILAFMNFLPIPGLDGGYVVFLLFEMITGKRVHEKVLEYATTAGLILLLGLMVYANGLDFFRIFTGK